jgi:hypothetical protein
MKAAIDDVVLFFSLFDQRDCVLPTKTSLRWGDEQSEVKLGRINAMPGYIGGEVNMAGIKWLGGSPSNPQLRGIPAPRVCGPEARGPAAYLPLIACATCDTIAECEPQASVRRARI